MSDSLFALNIPDGIEQIPPYQLALYGVFLLSFFVQLYYYLNVFRCATAPTLYPAASVEQTPVSVVICATNEYINLAKNLPLILEQDYPQFDVIVINDCSTDDTEELLTRLKVKYANLYYSNIEVNDKFKHDRKLAITLGVKASQHNNIVFIAPDCVPSSNKWLANMQVMFASSPDFVAGHCNYPEQNSIMRCDAIHTSLFAMNAIRKGFPFKINYDNLGISQKMFLEKKGFANINYLPHSEETLFASRNASAKNAVVNLLPESIMSSSRQVSFKYWWKQRLALSSLMSINKRGQTVRHLEIISRSFLYLAEVAFIALTAYYYELFFALMTIPFILIRFSLQISVLQRVRRVWKEKNTMFALFLYDRWSPVLALLIAFFRPNLHKIKIVK